MWTMSLTPPPPLWTDMDNWETPSLPLPVHGVYECRLTNFECVLFVRPRILTTSPFFSHILQLKRFLIFWWDKSIFIVEKSKWMGSKWSNYFLKTETWNPMLIYFYYAIFNIPIIMFRCVNWWFLANGSFWIGGKFKLGKKIWTGIFE